MRKGVAGLLLVVLVVASLGVGYLAAASAQHTETITSTTASVRTSTVTSQLTTTSTATSTITSAINGQPIPFASVETANITIAEGYDALAVNPNASRVYVAVGSSLTVVDASSHSVIADVNLPADISGGIAVDYKTNMVYVSLEGEVAEINGSTNAVVGELPVNLWRIAYDPSTNIIYGSSLAEVGQGQRNGTLVAVDALTGSVANISLEFEPYFVAINPQSNAVYVVGCHQIGLACDEMASIVNGTTEATVATIPLNSSYYPSMTANPTTNVFYASGGSELVALNGTNGNVIFDSNPQTCGPFPDMAVIPSSNQVIMVPQNSDYLLAYDGASGALVNMYSFPSSLLSVAFDPNTGELYVTTVYGQLLAFHDSAVIGNVNAALIGSVCLPV